MGLGSFGGGVGAVRFLLRRGAKVTVTDLADAETLADSMKQLADLPVEYHLGSHREEDFTAAHADLIVANPAVPCHSAYFATAEAQAVPVTAEIGIFLQLCPARIVGVTGTDGKSTTCAMIAASLQPTFQSRGRKVWLGGNIGRESLLEHVDQIDPNDAVVLELSSFQLYHLGRLGLSPHIAVVTNLTANHLDWHGDMQAYAQAKQNILRFQSPDDRAVLNRLDPVVCRWADSTAAAVTWYPADDRDDIDLQVPGMHNRLNAAAALAVANIMGVDESVSRSALKHFPGLPHRLELVAEIGGLRYYNDSIATTPASVSAAITAFGEKKVIILGGYDKKVPLGGLAEDLVADGTVETVILIGQVRQELSAQIDQAKSKHHKDLPHCELADDLPRAVAQAQAAGRPGMIVLLSPGCASYDMFKNFQDRGEQFRTAVMNMVLRPDPR